MHEFLNPKSMFTPGVAGALMMLLANAVCTSFPEIPFRYLALIFSFLIGAVVFTAANMKILERGIYWVINSLIIFSMGIGATNIAANVAKEPTNGLHNTQQIQTANLSAKSAHLPENVTAAKSSELAQEKSAGQENANVTNQEWNNIEKREKVNTNTHWATLNMVDKEQTGFFKRW